MGLDTLVSQVVDVLLRMFRNFSFILFFCKFRTQIIPWITLEGKRFSVPLFQKELEKMYETTLLEMPKLITNLYI